MFKKAAPAMYEETYKILAGVNLSPVKLEPSVQDAFIAIAENVTKTTTLAEKFEMPVQNTLNSVSESLTKLTKLSEKMEKPLTIFLYSAGFSLIIYSAAALITSIRSSFSRGSQPVEKPTNGRNGIRDSEVVP